MKFSMIIVVVIGILLISCENNPTESKQNDNVEPDIIQEIIDNTNLDSLTNYVNILSGEISANINGSTQRISSRHKNYPGNELAATYIYQILEQYGLDVYNQLFSITGNNVYAVQMGSEYPDQQYIICAHYDSMPDSSVSPGADDDASGTATVLEAGRILSNYQPKYTIIYALWDEEEQGLVGAFNYAFRAVNAGDNIIGVLNMDMIAWDSNNDGRFWINVRDTANSAHMSERMLQIHDQYDIGISPQVLNPGYGSDNVAFWLYGFPAIGIEEMYGEDWNIHYHLTSDRIENFNIPYFQKLSRLVIATLASLVEIKTI